jgi:outer membrane protein assembly factor BamE (lipoprotein component of BamABCDE complex)
MRIKGAILLLIGCVFLLQGCVISRGRVGNPLDEVQIQKVEKGSTKKDVVVALLGAPDRIIVGNGKEIFHYYYYDGKSPSLFLALINFISINVMSDNLYIFFDQQDVVQDVIYGKRTPDLRFRLRPWGP